MKFTTFTRFRWTNLIINSISERGDDDDDDEEEDDDTSIISTAEASPCDAIRVKSCVVYRIESKKDCKHVSDDVAANL